MIICTHFFFKKVSVWSEVIIRFKVNENVNNT
jgi:hypothetical protein